jgi:hypothetical protein
VETAEHFNFRQYRDNLSGGNYALLDLSQSRDRSSSAETERSARLAIRRRRIYGGFAAVWRASPATKRACRNGIVINQQGSNSEVLKIIKQWKFCTSEFLTLP